MRQKRKNGRWRCAIDNDAMWDPRPRIGDEPPRDEDDQSEQDESGQDESGQDDDSGDTAASTTRPPGRDSSVLVEIRGDAAPHHVGAMLAARRLPGFAVDEEYGAIPMEAAGTFVVRGTLSDTGAMEALAACDDVVKVWRDTPIAPF